MTSYDEVPYPIYSHSQTHPSELATLATLHGLKPTPVEHCRVLEIGCAQGGNILPMAYGLPNSQFVGIDMSARQIAEGQTFIDRLGLKNAKLQQLNLMDLDDSFGTFDYIIAHGFYSWVPAPVRERLMEACKQHLAPNGLAYISYNAYPGWGTLIAMRQMLLYRVRGVEEPLQRAALARELLKMMAEFSNKTRSVSASLTQAYAAYLQSMLNITKQGDEGYFLHDILEETNDPVYFHEFAQQAARHGLQYVTDSDFRTSQVNSLPTDVAEQLAGMAKDRIEWEQYCDFLGNRMFRQNILCHEGFEPNFKLSVEALQTFRYGSVAVPEGNVDVADRSIEKFVSFNKASLATDHPISKAAMHHLIDIWPHTATFAELLKAARQRLNIGQQDAATANADIQMLASNLLTGYMHSDQLVAFTIFEPTFLDAVSDRPLASAWARLQAETNKTVTTMRHGRYVLEPYEKFLIQMLDGQHDTGSLVQALLDGPIASGDLTLEEDDRAITDPIELHNLLRDGVEKTLNAFAGAPLLLA